MAMVSPPRPGCAARTWPTVQVHNRGALPGADLLVVEDVPVADIEVPRGKGLGSLLSHPRSLSVLRRLP